MDFISDIHKHVVVLILQHRYWTRMRRNGITHPLPAGNHPRCSCHFARFISQRLLMLLLLLNLIRFVFVFFYVFGLVAEFSHGILLDFVSIAPDFLEMSTFVKERAKCLYLKHIKRVLLIHISGSVLYC